MNSFFWIKVIASAVIIAVVSEISKRSGLWAAALASLPLVSLLSIVWIYAESRDTIRIIRFSNDVFWLVLPSLAFFLILPQLLSKGLPFWPSLVASSLVTMAAYAVTLKLLG